MEQFGYIKIGKYYFTKDPIGDLISKIENIIYRYLEYYSSQKVKIKVFNISCETLKYPKIVSLQRRLFRNFYPHPIHTKWDRFYRVKLKIY